MGKTEFTVIIIFYFFFALFIIAILIYIWQYKMKKKEHTIRLNYQENAHQKELLATQLEIKEQTMRHIGWEIHDNIGQKLTLASLYLYQLDSDNKVPKLHENIETIGAIINQSLEELRSLSKSLTNAHVENSTIEELLQLECQKINEFKNWKVTYSSNSQHTKLAYQTKSVLLRITQEFLQNSIKHAHCNNISLLFDKKEAVLTLVLKDDGQGFDTNRNKNTGIGLINMKKRAEIIGGKYSLQSSIGNGTTLTIEIPI